MADLRIDGEPYGRGTWLVVIAGECTSSALRPLLDRARGLVVMGATDVHVSLAGLTAVDGGGMQAIASFRRALAGCGVRVTFDQASGESGTVRGLLPDVA